MGLQNSFDDEQKTLLTGNRQKWDQQRKERSDKEVNEGSLTVYTIDLVRAGFSIHNWFCVCVCVFMWTVGIPATEDETGGGVWGSTAATKRRGCRGVQHDQNETGNWYPGTQHLRQSTFLLYSNSQCALPGVVWKSLSHTTVQLLQRCILHTLEAEVHIDERIIGPDTWPCYLEVSPVVG